jgi:hypothetical protein
MAKKKLTPRQERAVMVLAVGQKNETAAQAAGVGVRSVQKWMKDPTFREELRQTMERMRQVFEGRVMQLANNAAVVVQEMLQDHDPNRRAEGAKLALNAAVRLSTRYKELQMEGYVPPPQPMIVLPPGSRMPWENTPTAALPEAVEVEATIVGDGTESDDSGDGA